MASTRVLEEPDYTALSDFIDDSDKYVHLVDDSVISHSHLPLSIFLTLLNMGINCFLRIISLPQKICVLTMSPRCPNLLFFGKN